MLGPGQRLGLGPEQWLGLGPGQRLGLAREVAKTRGRAIATKANNAHDVIRMMSSG